MALGRKTGGRSAGTPNRKTVEIAERLAALGCDPIEGMARLAADPKNTPELRGRMYSELAQYVYPKRIRQAVEHSGLEGNPLRNVYEVVRLERPREFEHQAPRQLPAPAEDE